MGNKYGARRCEIDGVKFDSGAEAKVYLELRTLQNRKLISDLEVHPILKLLGPKNELICKIEADFKYVKQGKTHWIDVKSPATNTPLSKLKRKLAKAYLGVEIELYWV